MTRRFWPLIGGTEINLARLAAQFQASGSQTTILTARWQSDWPAEISHHGVKVVRLELTGRGFCDQLHYLRRLALWLKKHRSRFDLACVSTLRHDAYTVVGQARRRGFPVVLRAERSGRQGDCHWQRTARFGRQIKRRCTQAAALIAHQVSIERELTAASYPRDRIQHIPNGVPLPPASDAATRRQARANLADVHPTLSLEGNVPLVVYSGRLGAGKGLEQLVTAWVQVNTRCPAARLWLVGDGPQRRELQQRIDDLGLSDRVVLAGAFDDVEDFLRAADLFVLPAVLQGTSLGLLEAMAFGLGIVATDIANHRVLIQDGRSGRLVPPGSHEALAGGIVELLQRPDEAARFAAAARLRASTQFPLHRTVAEHLALFEKLLRPMQSLRQSAAS